MLKIAISGAARAGKDTLADQLEASLKQKGYKVIKMAFAEPLKTMYETNFHYLEDEAKPRDAYVILGNAFRAIDPNFWVRKMEQTLSTLDAIKGYDSDVAFIITDLRYLNEAAWAIGRNFTLVKVMAHDYIRQERAEQLGEKLDLDNEGDSEVNMLPHDIAVTNNGADDLLSMGAYAGAIIAEAELKEGLV